MEIHPNRTKYRLIYKLYKCGCALQKGSISKRCNYIKKIILNGPFNQSFIYHKPVCSMLHLLQQFEKHFEFTALKITEVGFGEES